MAWTIEINYTTGNSFGSEECTEEVGMAWNDLDKAKEALQAIKEHYKAYEKVNSCSYRSRPNKTTWKDFEHEDWCSEEYPEFTMDVRMDSGEFHALHVFWTGYFETLHGARIISSTEIDTDMEFTL